MTAKVFVSASLTLAMAISACGKRKSEEAKNIDIHGQWVADKADVKGKATKLAGTFVVIVSDSSVRMNIIDQQKTTCEDKEQTYSVSGNHVKIDVLPIENTNTMCQGYDLDIEKVDEDHMRIISGLGVDGLTIPFTRVTEDQSQKLIAIDGTPTDNKTTSTGSKKSSDPAPTSSADDEKKAADAEAAAKIEAMYGPMEGFWKLTSYTTAGGVKAAASTFTSLVVVLHIKNQTFIRYRSDNTSEFRLYHPFALTPTYAGADFDAYIDIKAATGTFQGSTVSELAFYQKSLKSVSATEMSFKYGLTITAGAYDTYTKITEAEAKTLLKDNIVYKNYFP